MSPTIRIDDEVYGWLQEHARPFEDTPNSVLRRFAGLDKDEEVAVEIHPNSSQTRNNEDVEPPTPSRIKTRSAWPRMKMGQLLNDEWKVGARHALYHKDGHWYNNLQEFPGALFDPDGCIIFETEEEYRNSSYLNIGQQTNVPKGISSIPGYIRKRDK